jgi:hypothetical protein
VKKERQPQLATDTRSAEILCGKECVSMEYQIEDAEMNRVVPSSPILVALMMEALRSSDTSVHTRVTRRNVPELCVTRTSMITL